MYTIHITVQMKVSMEFCAPNWEGVRRGASPMAGEGLHFIATKIPALAELGRGTLKVVCGLSFVLARWVGHPPSRGAVAAVEFRFPLGV